MCTVLVVDDDFDMRQSLSDILTDEGCGVATAADGMEALEYLERGERPCLILLDWMMPRCDGLQFRQRQQTRAELASIPVVLLSADGRVADKRSLIDAAEFLAKPVDLDVLLSVIGRYCDCA